MENVVDLQKNVYNKAEYIKTINTSFSELGTVTTTEQLIAQPNVEEFFALYNSLFYDIPSLGETNSHQFLIRTSGEYINFDETQSEIQALQAEIAQLRTDLLNAQMELAKSATSVSGNEDTNVALDVLQRELDAANQNLINTSTTLSNDTQTSQNTSTAGLSSGAGSGTTSTGGATGGATGGGASGGGGGGGY